VLLSIETAPTSPRVLLEIPSQIADLRRDRPEAAEAWREAVRRAFQAGLAAGYHATGFVREESSGQRRCFYVLERPGSGDGPESL
jgi:predicted GNAT superfamily acetyltransferase